MLQARRLRYESKSTIEHGFVSGIALENKWSESFIPGRIVKVC
jgi:hypothetical protein